MFTAKEKVQIGETKVQRHNSCFIFFGVLTMIPNINSFSCLKTWVCKLESDFFFTEKTVRFYSLSITFPVEKSNFDK